MMYIYALFLGLLFGALGLGPGGLFVTLFIIWLGRAIKKYEAYADRQVSRRTSYERELADLYKNMLWDAAQREHRDRLKGAEDVEFRVLR